MVLYIIYKDAKQLRECKDPEKATGLPDSKHPEVVVKVGTMAASEVHPIEPPKQETRGKGEPERRRPHGEEAAGGGGGGDEKSVAVPGEIELNPARA